VTLSLPQNIHMGASPTFAGMTLSGFTGNNAVIYGTAGTGVLATVTTSSANQCLLSGGSAPTWGACTSGGGLAGSGTTGQIAFFNGANSVTSETSGFAWDSTNKKLGVGNDSPVGKLDVSGKVTGKALAILNETGNQAIFTASASGLTRFEIANDG